MTSEELQGPQSVEDFRDGLYQKQWQKVANLIGEHCLLEGDYLLSAGEKSDTYFDLRQLTYNGGYLNELVQLAEHRLMDLGWDFDTVGGSGAGAGPLASGIAGEGDFFMIRPADKQHGTGGRIAGRLREGQRILLVDDVTTTGKYFLEHTEFLQSEGYEIAGGLVVIDRSGGATEKIMAEFGAPFECLYSADEIELVFGA